MSSSACPALFYDSIHGAALAFHVGNKLKLIPCTVKIMLRIFRSEIYVTVYIVIGRFSSSSSVRYSPTVDKNPSV